MIGLPPSSLGLFQERVMESIDVSTAYGDPGAVGGSESKNNNYYYSYGPRNCPSLDFLNLLSIIVSFMI